MKALAWLSVTVVMMGSAAPGMAADSAATDLNNRGIQEAQAGRLEQGIRLVREALARDPGDAKIRQNLSLMLTEQAHAREQAGAVEEARALLAEALQYDSSNGRAMILLGNAAYFYDSDFADAIRWWESAHGRVSAAEWQGVAQRLSQARRDQSAEQRFAVERTANFQIRFEGPASRAAAARLGTALEAEYGRLGAALGVWPDDLTVIVYPRGAFQRVSAERDGVIGFYDGRIRIRAEEVGTPREAWVLPHELAHAFLHKGFGARLPTWVHEGYAQTRESGRVLTPREQALLAAIRSGARWIPLKWLDGHFQRPSDTEDVMRAYLEARVVVEFLLARHGPERWVAFLRRLADGEPTDRAFDRAFAPLRWARVEQGLPE